jgi:hypothetical protein
VIDLAQQRLEPVVRALERLLGRKLLPLQPDGGKRTGKALLDELHELAAGGLHDIVGGARLERGDRDAALLRPVT